MSVIHTFTGKQFDPINPQPQDICIEDIAHALSLQCRFGGHCKTFYSVAQHSIFVSNYCKNNKLWGLLHDASEAVIYDICTPLKGLLTNYKEIEKNIMGVICEKYGLEKRQPEEVYKWDKVLLLTESRDLLALPIKFEEKGCWPLEEVILPWSPRYAETEFLNTFWGLMIGRKLN